MEALGRGGGEVGGDKAGCAQVVLLLVLSVARHHTRIVCKVSVCVGVCMCVL